MVVAGAPAEVVVAAATREQVVAGAADELVVARVAGQLVVRRADELVVRRRCLEPVTTGATVDLVVPSAAEQLVVPGATVDDVLAGGPLDGVVAVTAADQVVTPTAVDRVVAAQADDDVVPTCRRGRPRRRYRRSSPSCRRREGRDRRQRGDVTVNADDAGLASRLPRASTALTSKVCAPVATSRGERTGAGRPRSAVQTALERRGAIGADEGEGRRGVGAGRVGPEVIVVSGAVVSTVNPRLAGVEIGVADGRRSRAPRRCAGRRPGPPS